MENQKNKNIRMNLVSKPDNWIEAFRENVGMLRYHYGWSVHTLALKVDMSENTLNNFLKGKTKDCDQSMAIKLARAFNVTVDELIGAGTMDPETRECVAMAGQLKPYHRYVIRSYVKHQYLLHSEEASNKQISVMLPDCQHGFMKHTNITEALSVGHLPPQIKSEVCLGVKIPCSHYEPHFMPGETLLLGAHREGFNNEKCVVSKDGNLYICIKKIKIENGIRKINYFSIINGKQLFNYEDIDDRIGYLIGFLDPDGELGVR